MNSIHIALFALLLQISAQPAATVQGVVLKAVTGEPISGARVELTRRDGTTPQVYSTITEPDGTFTIQNVRPGLYRLSASRSGFLRREFGQRTRNGLGLALNLDAGQQLRNLEIELRPAAAISGRVTDRSGDPLAAAEVRALLPTYQDGQRILRTVQSTITNDLGEYRLFGLAAGQYYVSVSPSGDIPLVTLTVNPSLSSVINLPTSGPLSQGSTPVYYPSTTDSRIAAPIDVTSGGDYGGVNITMVAVKPHHIRGNVLGGMARVTLVPADPGMTTTVRGADASNGPFDFSSVSAGEYTLVARSGDQLGTTAVSLGDGDLDNVTIGLNPTVPVPTRVSFEDRTPGETDPELESVTFNLVADPPIPGAPPDVYGPFPNGFLAFGVLLRQDFRVNNLRVTGAPSTTRLRNVYIKSIRMGNRDVVNDGLRVDDPENIPPIEIVLGIHPGILTGTVVTEKKKPTVNATVLLVPESRRRRWADEFRTVTADLSGRFVFDRIPPGDYIVLSWEEVEDGAWMDPEFMKKHEQHGVRVRINEGANPIVNITAVP